MKADYYTGNGSSYRTISVGFTPKAVLEMPENATLTASVNVYGGLAVTGCLGSHNGYTTLLFR